MDVNKIQNLTLDEVLVVVKLQELAQKAKELSHKIFENYRCFGINETRIEVWNDGNNAEYLTHNGQWQARYLHQKYDVMCTEEGIFEVLKAEYFVKNNLIDNPDTKMREMAEACGYFMVFANDSRKAHGKIDMSPFRNVE